MEKKYDIYKKSIKVGEILCDSSINNTEIEVKSYNTSIHYYFLKRDFMEKIVIEKSSRGMLDTLVIYRKENFIKVNNRELFFYTPNFLFVEMLFRYNELTRDQTNKKYKKLNILNDSCSHINLYHIYELDQKYKFVIKPTPAEFKLSLDGELIEYYDKTDKKLIKMIKGA